MYKILINTAFLLFSFYNLLSQTPKEELTRLVDSYKIPFDYQWYQPEKKYVKISTNQDKIYYILSDSIFTYEPSFVNKQHKFFHLLHKGKEIPIYIISRNEFFDSGDTLFFIGSRPVGDTTWLDPFSKFEVFYLTYDESHEGLRFTNFVKPSNANLSIQYINVTYHFEEHHQYSIGQPEHSSQTVNGEGWVWELLSPSDDWIKQDKFSFTRSLYPWQFADSVTFRFFAFSSKFDSIYTNHNIIVFINGDTAYQNIFPGGKNLDFSFKFPTSKILLGENSFEIVSKGTIKTDGKLALPDVIGFQFLEYSAKEIPFANNGFVSFNLNSDFANKSIEINNFRTPTVCLVDTTNKQIGFLSAVPSVSFWVNSYNRNLRINFNDTLFSSSQKGLHLVTFDSISNGIKYWFYPDENSKVVTDIRNLPNNSVYLVAFNGNKINNEILNFFLTEGSNTASRVKDGNVWIFAKKIGTKDQFETAGNSNNIALVGKFGASFSNKFSTLINFPENFKEANFFVSDGFALETPRLGSVERTDLYETNRQADVIVVAPKIFKDVADKYIEYRKTTESDKKFFLAFVEDVYKEFNFGKKSPEAVKRFLVWAFYQWKNPRPKYLVIIGDANRDPRNVLTGSIYKDHVPTFGYPATDVWYSFLAGNDFNPDIHVGRIPITNIQEGYAYLEKIKEYDRALTAPWMKKFLFLSGGINELEREYFFERLNGDFAEYILRISPICVRTQVIRKSDAVVGSEADASFIRSAINDGVQFMVFAGHGSAKVFDTDGWKVQTLNNKGKYGFFASFSCNTANFAEPTLVSRNEEYVIYPEKGFVGTLGSGGVGLRLHSLLLATYLFEIIADSTIKTDYFVDLVDIAKERMIRGYVDFENILTIYHYVFLGDPLLRLRIRRYPDLYFIDNKVDISNEFGKSNFTQSDSLFIIRGLVGNIGFSKKGEYSVWLIHQYNERADTLKKLFKDLCSVNEFQFQIPISKEAGLHSFKIIINPEQKLFEYDYSNNSLSYNIEVYVSSLFPIDPLSNWNIQKINPIFRFVDPNYEQERDSYRFSIFSEKRYFGNLLYVSQSQDIEVTNVRIDWKPKIVLPEGHFWLFAEKFSKDTAIPNQSQWIPFHTQESSSDSIVILSFSSKEEFDYSTFTFTNMSFDSSANSMKIEPLRIPYKILSCSGNNRSEKGKEITVNNKVYVTMAPDLDIVGFHIVLISHKDFSIERYVIFETWGTEPPEKDSSSIHLIRFLRDSVPDNDYIFLVVHNSALRVPISHQISNPTSPGSLDSLRQVFREWGCNYADSIGSDLRYYGNSFFMVGRKFQGKKILLDEGFDLDGDSVESEGFIYQIPNKALVKSPIFGPAKLWKFLNLDISFIDTTIRFKTKLFGYSVPQPYKKDFILEVDDLNSFDLSKLDAQKYPYIQFETTISNPSEAKDISFRRFNLEFIPTPEIAIEIEKPLQKFIDTLRGEEVTYSVAVHNLSPRTSTDSLLIFLKQKSISQELDYSIFSLKSLDKNQIYFLNGTLVTDKFDNSTNIVFDVQQSYHELYKFNNSESLFFNIKEDTNKPSILLYLDGVKIQGGEYVSKIPSVYIEIYDNGRLPFDTNSTTLLINIKKISKIFQFISYGKDVPLKCTYSFTSDELEYGLNHFTIYTTDPSGNRDTLDVPVYVARKAKIVSYSVGPNPTKEGATFYVNYVSPKVGATAIIDIYDYMGNVIRSISKPINLNEDYIFWDGLDSEGRYTSQGIYFFKISIVGEIYSDPVFGKFIKIK